MKKNLLMITLAALLVMSCTQLLLAEEHKTILENDWENYLTNAEIEYDQNHGKISMFGIYETDFFTDYFFHSDVSGKYSLTDDLEVWGSFDAGLLQEAWAEEAETTVDDYHFGGKYQLSSQKNLTVAAGATVNYYRTYGFLEESKPSFNASLYVDKKVNSDFKVYEFFNAFVDHENFAMTFMNGVEYELDRRSAVKAYVKTYVDKDFDYNIYGGALYKKELTKDCTNLFRFYTHLEDSYFSITDTLERKFAHDLVATGEINFNSEKPFFNYALVNVEKELDKLTVDWQVELPTIHEHSTRIYFSSNASYELTEDMNLILNVEKRLERMEVGSDVEWDKDIYTAVGVSYEL